MSENSNYVRLRLDESGQVMIVDSDFLREIREFLSAKNKAAAFCAFAGDDKFYAITPTGKTLIGLLDLVVNTVKILRPGLKVQICPQLMHASSPKLQPEIFPLPNTSYSLRDYQQVAVEKCLARGRGIVLQPTGSGKTPTIGTLAYTLWKQNQERGMVLIVVPDRGLAGKTYEDFIGFGLPNVSRWYDKYSPDPDCAFLIASHKILYINPERSIPIISNCIAVICDEVHTINRGCKINKILASCHTFHKFGFTGTLPDAPQNVWNAVGMIGPVVVEDKAQKLTNQGYIAGVKIKIFKLKYKEKPVAKGTSYIDDYHQECDFLYAHPFRNEVIKRIVAATKNNCLILVERKAHGLLLLDILKDSGKQVFFVQGNVEVDVRAEIIKHMENHNDVIAVAMMQIFRQGISVDNIHYLLLASLGKARSRLIQSIGRGRRKPGIKNNNLTVFDIADDLNFSNKHAKQRQAIYREESFEMSISEIVEP